MKNKIVSNKFQTFKRLTKTSARKAFDDGAEVYIMSIDRNPVNSLTSSIIYYLDCLPMCRWIKERVVTFDDALEDFSEWLNTEGYGHIPQRYYAKNYLFSFWVEV